MKDLLYFNDETQENFLIRHRLGEFAVKNNIQYAEITGDQILSGDLDKRADVAFIMPGGEAKYYSKALGVTGNQKIKDFVANGGVYFGICSGAYYACDAIDWHDELTGEKIDTQTTHKAQTPLGFVPVTAKGPVYQFPRDIAKEPNSYFTLVKSRMVLPGQRPFDCVAIYNGGPGIKDVAELADKDDSVTILAGMANGKEIMMPAVIEKQFGLGRVIATSLHFEVESKHLVGSNPVYKPLKGSTRTRMNQFGHILKEHEQKQRQKAFDM